MTPRKVNAEQAIKVVTDLQACQIEIDVAKSARDKAQVDLDKAQEKYRLAVNRLEAAVLARDEMLASTIGGV